MLKACIVWMPVVCLIYLPVSSFKKKKIIIKLNEFSGVYIISTQSGMIKVDDSTASKLTSCVNAEDRKKIMCDSKITMINETEVRKIPASQVAPKVGILRKESQQIVQRKEQPSVNILQKTRPQLVRASPVRTPPHRQILLGGQKTRPLPGPIVSPLRLPVSKPRVSIKPATPRARVTNYQLKISIKITNFFY